MSSNGGLTTYRTYFLGNTIYLLRKFFNTICITKHLRILFSPTCNSHKYLVLLAVTNFLSVTVLNVDLVQQLNKLYLDLELRPFQGNRHFVVKFNCICCKVLNVFPHFQPAVREAFEVTCVLAIKA